jgi:hypothetical protein
MTTERYNEMYYFKILSGSALRLEDSAGTCLKEKLAERPFYMGFSFLKDVIKCGCGECNSSILRFNHKLGHLLIVDASDVEIVATTVAQAEMKKRQTH